MRFKLLIWTVSIVLLTFGLSFACGVDLREVVGLDGYLIPDGGTLQIRIGFVGDESQHIMTNNGFMLTSEHCTWSNVTGEWNPAHPWATWFDMVRVINCTDYRDDNVADGIQDTIGTGLMSIFGTGLPIDFNDVALILTVGPIDVDNGEMGVIILDSSWYRPSNDWCWDICEMNVSWSGPHRIGDPQSGVAFNDGAGLPTAFGLSQNYPNPFNPSTVLKFDVPRKSQVEIAVYNVLGQRVKILVNEELAAGSYETTWNGSDEGGRAVATGVYFFRMQAGDFVKTKKAMMLK